MRVLLCFVAIAAFVAAHPNGALTCEVSETSQMGGPRYLKNDWSVQADKSAFRLGESVLVTIKHPSDKWKGLLMYAMTPDGNRVGSFVELDKSIKYINSNLNCGPAKSVITQVNSAYKPNEMTFKWIAPDFHVPRVTFKTSIVVSHAADWYLPTDLVLEPASSPGVKEAAIIGSGASFPNPVMQKWAADYHVIPSVGVKYISKGSGGGIKDFIAQKTTFAGSDAPLSGSERQQLLSQGRSVLHIPETMGAVVVVHNIPKQYAPDEVRLTPDLTAKIFAGDITSWKDSSIVKLNPDFSKIPDSKAKITVVRREDKSGTTFVFTSYLANFPSWTFAPNKAWKATGESMAAKGNEGVTDKVLTTPFSISYTESGLALRSGLREVSLQNKAGTFLTSQNADLGAAAAVKKFPANDASWDGVDIANQDGERTWPIATLTYILVDADLSSKGEQGALLVCFLEFLMSRLGQAEALDQGFVPLPESLLKSNLQAIRSLKLAAPVNDRRAAYCITAARGTAVNYPSSVIAEWSATINRNSNTNTYVGHGVKSRAQALDELKSGLAQFVAIDLPVDTKTLGAGEYLHLPATAGAVSIVHNVPNSGQLNLDADLVAQIFQYEIRKWNDPKLVKLNPWLADVSNEINVIVRSDESGTNFVFSDYLSKASSVWKHGATATRWPDPEDVAYGADGNAGVGNMVQVWPYAIGFVNFVVQAKLELPEAALKNAAGKFVLASKADITSSLATMQLPSLTEDWSKVSAVNLQGDSAFPIVSLTYIVTQKELDQFGDSGSAVKALLQLGMSAYGQSIAQTKGFAQLPSSLLEDSRAAIDAINTASDSDPYVTTGLYGTGASFPVAVLKEWASIMNQRNAFPIQIQYLAKGSGGGVKDFTQKFSNFGASDAPLKISEMEAMGRKTLTLPETMGALVIAVNIPEMGTKTLNLSAEQISKIYQQEYTSWKDLVDGNPWLASVNKPIVPVARSDKSGSTYVFTDFLSAAAGSDWKIGVVKTFNSFPEGTTGASGNSGIGEKLTQTPYSIGYIDFDLAQRLGLAQAAVQNKDGNFIKPKDADIAAAGARTFPSADGDWSKVSIVFQPGANTWPIATLTYLIVDVDQTNRPAKEGALLKSFLAYAQSKHAQFSAFRKGFNPLPESLTKANLAAIATIKVKDESLVAKFSVTGVVGAGIPLPDTLSGSAAAFADRVPQNVRTTYFSVADSVDSFVKGFVHFIVYEGSLSAAQASKITSAFPTDKPITIRLSESPELSLIAGSKFLQAEELKLLKSLLSNLNTAAAQLQDTSASVNLLSSASVVENLEAIQSISADSSAYDVEALGVVSSQASIDQLVHWAQLFCAVSSKPTEIIIKAASEPTSYVNQADIVASPFATGLFSAIPVSVGGAVVAISIPEASGLVLDGDTLGKIFAGQITKWNDPALVTLNKGLSGFNQDIKSILPVAGSGMYELLKDYTGRTISQAKAANSNHEVGEFLLDNSYAIGILEPSSAPWYYEMLAKTPKIKEVLLINANKEVVGPRLFNLNAAVGSDGGLNVAAKGAYPLAYIQYLAFSKSNALTDSFTRFVLSSAGQAQTGANNLAAVPLSSRTKSAAAVKTSERSTDDYLKFSGLGSNIPYSEIAVPSVSISAPPAVSTSNACKVDSSWVHPKYKDTCKDYQPGGKSAAYKCDPGPTENCCTC